MIPGHVEKWKDMEIKEAYLDTGGIKFEDPFQAASGMPQVFLS
jgi:hypothetical protein